MKEYEFIQHIEGLALKTHITYFISFSKSLFHWHREIEILLVIDGPIEVYTENAQYLLETNDIFLINTNEAHCILKTHEMSAALIIQISPSFCNAYYHELKQTRFLERHLKDNGNNKIVWESVYSYILALMNSLYKKEEGHRFEIMGIINMVFYHLFHSIKYEEVSEERRITETRNMNRLNRIIGYMQENFTNKISLAILAEKEELDLYYLSHFIKKHLGMSFNQYLNKLRLEKALELFLRTDKRKIDICYESGFSDYRYLSKAFVNEYGCTPSQYKALHKDKFVLDYKDCYYKGSLNVDNDQYIMLNQEDTFKKIFDYLSKNDNDKINNLFNKN